MAGNGIAGSSDHSTHTMHHAHTSSSLDKESALDSGVYSLRVAIERLPADKKAIIRNRAIKLKSKDEWRHNVPKDNWYTVSQMSDLVCEKQTGLERGIFKSLARRRIHTARVEIIFGVVGYHSRDSVRDEGPNLRRLSPQQQLALLHMAGFQDTKDDWVQFRWLWAEQYRIWTEVSIEARLRKPGDDEAVPVYHWRNDTNPPQITDARWRLILKLIDKRMGELIDLYRKDCRKILEYLENKQQHEKPHIFDEDGKLRKEFYPVLGLKKSASASRLWIPKSHDKSGIDAFEKEEFIELLHDLQNDFWTDDGFEGKLLQKKSSGREKKGGNSGKQKL